MSEKYSKLNKFNHKIAKPVAALALSGSALLGLGAGYEHLEADKANSTAEAFAQVGDTANADAWETIGDAHEHTRSILLIGSMTVLASSGGALRMATSGNQQSAAHHESGAAPPEPLPHPHNQ